MGLNVLGSSSADRSMSNYRDRESNRSDCESNYRDCEYDGTAPGVSIRRTNLLRVPLGTVPIKKQVLTPFEDIQREEDLNMFKQIDTTPEPNKSCFTIFSISEGDKYDMVTVRYKHCTTFGGLKVLLVKKGSVSYDMDVLDPHFFEEGFIVGRFAPSNEGIELARSLID